MWRFGSLLFARVRRTEFCTTLVTAVILFAGTYGDVHAVGSSQWLIGLLAASLWPPWRLCGCTPFVGSTVHDLGRDTYSGLVGWGDTMVRMERFEQFESTVATVASWATGLGDGGVDRIIALLFSLGLSDSGSGLWFVSERCFDPVGIWFGYTPGFVGICLFDHLVGQSGASAYIAGSRGFNDHHGIAYTASCVVGQPFCVSKRLSGTMNGNDRFVEEKTGNWNGNARFVQEKTKN